MDLSEYKKRKVSLRKRLKEFSDNKDWFYELCFCLLTPQSNAFKCDAAVQTLKENDFRNRDFNPEGYLMTVRFYKNKSRYLVEMKKKYKLIEANIKKDADAIMLREWLVGNVKGLGFKESSHFLRNIGFRNLAILDRHILKNLKMLGVVNQIPKTLTRKCYFEIERKFLNFSKQAGIPMDELDLFFWSLETGKVFK